MHERYGLISLFFETNTPTTTTTTTTTIITIIIIIITIIIIIVDLSVAVDGGVLILPVNGSFLNVGVRPSCRQDDIIQRRLSRPKI